MVCEVDCKVSDWLTWLGREGIGTSMMMQY